MERKSVQYTTLAECFLVENILRERNAPGESIGMHRLNNLRNDKTTVVRSRHGVMCTVVSALWMQALLLGGVLSCANKASRPIDPPAATVVEPAKELTRDPVLGELAGLLPEEVTTLQSAVKDKAFSPDEGDDLKKLFLYFKDRGDESLRKAALVFLPRAAVEKRNSDFVPLAVWAELVVRESSDNIKIVAQILQEATPGRPENEIVQLMLLGEGIRCSTDLAAHDAALIAWKEASAVSPELKLTVLRTVLAGCEELIGTSVGDLNGLLGSNSAVVAFRDVDAKFRTMIPQNVSDLAAGTDELRRHPKRAQTGVFGTTREAVLLSLPRERRNYFQTHARPVSVLSIQSDSIGFKHIASIERQLVDNLAGPGATTTTDIGSQAIVRKIMSPFAFTPTGMIWRLDSYGRILEWLVRTSESTRALRLSRDPESGLFMDQQTRLAALAGVSDQASQFGTEWLHGSRTAVLLSRVLEDSMTRAGLVNPDLLPALLVVGKERLKTLVLGGNEETWLNDASKRWIHFARNMEVERGRALRSTLYKVLNSLPTLQGVALSTQSDNPLVTLRRKLVFCSMTNAFDVESKGLEKKFSLRAERNGILLYSEDKSIFDGGLVASFVVPQTLRDGDRLLCAGQVVDGDDGQSPRVESSRLTVLDFKPTLSVALASSQAWGDRLSSTSVLGPDGLRGLTVSGFAAGEIIPNLTVSAADADNDPTAVEVVSNSCPKLTWQANVGVLSGELPSASFFGMQANGLRGFSCRVVFRAMASGDVEGESFVFEVQSVNTPPLYAASIISVYETKFIAGLAPDVCADPQGPRELCDVSIIMKAADVDAQTPLTARCIGFVRLNNAGQWEVENNCPTELLAATSLRSEANLAGIMRPIKDLDVLPFSTADAWKNRMAIGGELTHRLTLPANFSGARILRYALSDGSPTDVTVDVPLVVRKNNRRPTVTVSDATGIVRQKYFIQENRQLALSVKITDPDVNETFTVRCVDCSSGLPKGVASQQSGVFSFTSVTNGEYLLRWTPAPAGDSLFTSSAAVNKTNLVFVIEATDSGGGDSSQIRRDAQSVSVEAYGLNRPPVNYTATLSSSQLKVGDNVTCDGAILVSDPDADELTFSYDWEVGSPSSGVFMKLDGIRASALRVTPAMAHKSLRCVMKVSDQKEGGDVSATSSLARVVNSAPSPTAEYPSPQLSALVAAVGQSISCTMQFRDWDGDPFTTSYQWEIEAAAGGSWLSTGVFANSILINPLHSHRKLRCKATATDDYQSPPEEAAFSSTRSVVSDVAVVQNVPPQPFVPVLTVQGGGDALVGKLVQCSATVTDPDFDLLSLQATLEWYDDDSLLWRNAREMIPLSTTLSANEAHRLIRCRMTADDGFANGRTESVSTARRVENSRPRPFAAFVRTTTPLRTGELALCEGMTSDDDGDSLNHAISWEVSSSPVSDTWVSISAAGVIERALTAPPLAANAYLRCKVSAMEQQSAIFSNVTTQVAVSAPVVVGNTAPVIASIALRPTAVNAEIVVGTEMNCTVGSSDADLNELSLRYTFYLKNDALSSVEELLGVQTSSKHIITRLDARKLIGCRVVVTDAFGGTASADSGLIVIKNKPPEDFGATLTVQASNAALSDSPPMVLDTVQCNGTTTDADDAGAGLPNPLTGELTGIRVYTIVWQARVARYALTGAQLNASLPFEEVTRGPSRNWSLSAAFAHKEIRCLIVAEDMAGGLTTSFVSSTKEVVNSAPDNFAVTFDSSDYRTGDTLSCLATPSDRDGDALSVVYRWSFLAAGADPLNASAWEVKTNSGQGVADNQFKTSLSYKHGSFRCKVTATDHFGLWRSTESMVHLQNTPPISFVPSIAATRSEGTTSRSLNFAVEGPQVGDVVFCLLPSFPLQPADPKDNDSLTFRYKFTSVSAGLNAQGALVPIDSVLRNFSSDYSFTIASGSAVGALRCSVEAVDSFHAIDGQGLTIVESPTVAFNNKTPEPFTATLNHLDATKQGTNPRMGDVLSCVGATTDADGDALVYSYVWQKRATPTGEWLEIKNTAGIAYRTSSTLMVRATEIIPHGQIRCQMVATDTAFNTRSSGYSVDMNLGNTAPQQPVITVDKSGIKIGEAVTCASTGVDDDTTDVVSKTYQWQVENVPGTWTAIVGATDLTFTAARSLAPTIAHKRLRCLAQHADSFGGIATQYSTAVDVLNSRPRLTRVDFSVPSNSLFNISLYQFTPNPQAVASVVVPILLFSEGVAHNIRFIVDDIDGDSVMTACFGPCLGNAISRATVNPLAPVYSLPSNDTQTALTWAPPYEMVNQSQRSASVSGTVALADDYDPSALSFAELRAIVSDVNRVTLQDITFIDANSNAVVSSTELSPARLRVRVSNPDRESLVAVLDATYLWSVVSSSSFATAGSVDTWIFSWLGSYDHVAHATSTGPRGFTSEQGGTWQRGVRTDVAVYFGSSSGTKVLSTSVPNFTLTDVDRPPVMPSATLGLYPTSANHEGTDPDGDAISSVSVLPSSSYDQWSDSYNYPSKLPGGSYYCTQQNYGTRYNPGIYAVTAHGLSSGNRNYTWSNGIERKMPNFPVWLAGAGAFGQKLTIGSGKPQYGASFDVYCIGSGGLNTTIGTEKIWLSYYRQNGNRNYYTDMPCNYENTGTWLTETEHAWNWIVTFDNAICSMLIDWGFTGTSISDRYSYWNGRPAGSNPTNRCLYFDRMTAGYMRNESSWQDNAICIPNDSPFPAFNYGSNMLPKSGGETSDHQGGEFCLDEFFGWSTMSWNATQDILSCIHLF